MPTRNSRCPIVAGSVQLIEAEAATLCLAITTDEAVQVLDYIGEHQLALIPIEVTEEVINHLFSDRFVEP